MANYYNPMGPVDPSGVYADAVAGQSVAGQLWDWLQSQFSGGSSSASSSSGDTPAATAASTDSQQPSGPLTENQKRFTFGGKVPSAAQADMMAAIADRVGESSSSSSSGSGGGGGVAAPSQYVTPDGKVITVGSEEDRYYNMVNAIYRNLYGTNATWAEAKLFRDQGVENTYQLQAMMEQMPSHISGPNGDRIPIGQYIRIRDAAQKLADKYFGRPIPDSLVDQFAREGTTSPAAIAAWFDGHAAKDIPKEQYGAIFDEAVKWTRPIWNTVPSPDQIVSFAQQPTAVANSPEPAVSVAAGGGGGGSSYQGLVP